MIIQLPDGYNGSVAKFDSFPLQYDGECVKLQCADIGNEWMIRWVSRADLNQAIINSLNGG